MLKNLHSEELGGSRNVEERNIKKGKEPIDVQVEWESIHDNGKNDNLSVSEGDEEQVDSEDEVFSPSVDDGGVNDGEDDSEYDEELDYDLGGSEPVHEGCGADRSPTFVVGSTYAN